MEWVCPVCNEMEDKIFFCEKCGNLMVDKGRVQEYMDPYGAEMPVDDEENYCVHLYKCEKCSEIKRIGIRKVEV